MISNIFFLITFIILGKVTHIFNRNWSFTPLNFKIHSFTLGVLITALFFIFLKELYHTSNFEISLIIFLFTFSIIFYLFKFTKKTRLNHELKTLFHYFHEFQIGLLIATIPSLAVMFPLFFLRFSSSLDEHLNHHHKHNFKKYSFYLTEIMVILGFSIGYLSNISHKILFEISLSVVIAHIFYKLIDNLYHEKKFNLNYLFLGEIIFIILVLIEKIL